MVEVGGGQWRTAEGVGGRRSSVEFGGVPWIAGGRWRTAEFGGGWRSSVEDSGVPLSAAECRGLLCGKVW